MLMSLEDALLAGMMSGCGALPFFDSCRPEKATTASGTRSTANPIITKMIIGPPTGHHIKHQCPYSLDASPHRRVTAME